MLLHQSTITAPQKIERSRRAGLDDGFMAPLATAAGNAFKTVTNKGGRCRQCKSYCGHFGIIGIILQRGADAAFTRT
jgi:hypothetical protein